MPAHVSKAAIIAIAVLASVPAVAPAFAQNCFELGNCPITNFLEWAIYPYIALVGKWILPIVWGAVLGLLYIRTTNAPYVAVVGFFVFAIMIVNDPTIYSNSATGQLIYWGILMGAVGFGCTLYYLIKVRVHNPI